MKKILALIIMIAGIFVSCGHKEESKSTKELLAEKSNTTDSATTDNTYPPVIEDMGYFRNAEYKFEKGHESNCGCAVCYGLCKIITGDKEEVFKHTVCQIAHLNRKGLGPCKCHIGYGQLLQIIK